MQGRRREHATALRSGKNMEKLNQPQTLVKRLFVLNCAYENGEHDKPSKIDPPSLTRFSWR